MFLILDAVAAFHSTGDLIVIVLIEHIALADALLILSGKRMSSGIRNISYLGLIVISNEVMTGKLDLLFFNIGVLYL